MAPIAYRAGIVGVFAFLLGVLALVGAALVSSRPTAGGVLMILAGVVNFLGRAPGFFVAVLLVAGGILALAGGSQAAPAAGSGVPPFAGG